MGLPTYCTRTQFDPRRIGTVLAWLDAQDASTIDTVTGNVSEWRSRVGAVKATQTTATNRPAYTLAGRNGRNIVTFDGSNDFLTTTEITQSQPFTIFFAGRSVGNTTAQAGEFPYIVDGSTSSDRVILAHGNGNNINSADNGRLGMFAGSSLLLSATAAASYNAWGVIAAVFNGASSFARVNGTQVISGNPGSNALGSLTLGTRFASRDATTWFEGDFGAFLVMAGALSSSQLSAVERWLGATWGVTVA